MFEAWRATSAKLSSGGVVLAQTGLLGLFGEVVSERSL